MEPVLVALQAFANYDASTGHFIRRHRTSANAPAGVPCGTVSGGGYRYIRVLGRHYRASRLAWLWVTGDWPAGVVDHANGDRQDDRWANLRLATSAQNCANAKLRADNTTGFKGVKPLNGRWQARIGTGGKHHLGTFDTPEEAHAAYVGAARVLYGKFARAS